ncbi:MAG: phospholipase D [uncultured archaeon A07HR60]|nr:MAG: phospholipase D [uncultured archaeon A07HR60]
MRISRACNLLIIAIVVAAGGLAVTSDVSVATTEPCLTAVQPGISTDALNSSRNGKGASRAPVYSDHDPLSRAHSANRWSTDGLIRAVYPNPPANGDPGEYLRLYLPTRGAWTLTDGHTTVDIATSVVGEVVVAVDPVAASTHVDAEVIRLHGRLQMADDGDRITLQRGETPVDRVSYDRAPEGELWSRARGWRPIGYEPRSGVDCGSATVTGFLLPDAETVPIARVEDARDRLYLAAYTFESRRIANALLAAAQRGVDVRVLVDGAPVGGVSNRSAAILDRLARSSIDVRVTGGDTPRFRFHHAKYAVIDDTALITTENWKPSGTGGRSNRGWGIVVADPGFAAELATVYATDTDESVVTTWEDYRSNREFFESSPAQGSFPARFEPQTTDAARVELLTAPGNAERRLIDRIDAAQNRVHVIVPSVGSENTSLVRAVVRAAERGVEVRLLLSDAWYHADDNEALTTTLGQTDAGRTGNLTVKVADPRGRYETIHAKGVVIDNQVAVGSLNWNEHATTNNREVVAVVESPALADYFALAHQADWHGGSRLLPVCLLVWLLCLIGGATWLGYQAIQFEAGSHTE